MKRRMKKPHPPQPNGSLIESAEDETNDPSGVDQKCRCAYAIRSETHIGSLNLAE